MRISCSVDCQWFIAYTRMTITRVNGPLMCLQSAFLLTSRSMPKRKYFFPILFHLCQSSDTSNPGANFCSWKSCRKFSTFWEPRGDWQIRRCDWLLVGKECCTQVNGRCDWLVLGKQCSTQVNLSS